jgi:hypothetical protein
MPLKLGIQYCQVNMAAYSYFLQFPVLLRICVAHECLYWRQCLSKGMAKGETLEQFGLPCQY